MAFINRAYDHSADQYSATGDIPKMPLLNTYTATNLGDTTVTVDGVTLFPSLTPLTDRGDSVVFQANENEIYAGKIIVSFLSPLGATPLVEIVQQYYLKDEYNK